MGALCGHLFSFSFARQGHTPSRLRIQLSRVLSLSLSSLEQEGKEERLKTQSGFLSFGIVEESSCFFKHYSFPKIICKHANTSKDML